MACELGIENCICTPKLGFKRRALAFFSQKRLIRIPLFLSIAWGWLRSNG